MLPSNSFYYKFDELQLCGWFSLSYNALVNCVLLLISLKGMDLYVTSNLVLVALCILIFLLLEFVCNVRKGLWEYMKRR